MSAWWKQRREDLRLCSRCGGLLAWRLVATEGRKRFVCGGCAFISYENPKIVAATIPEREGRVILLRRGIEPSKGLWTYPAGFMEMGETVEDAARRETREEIRSRVRISGPPRIYSYVDAGVVTMVYPARIVSGRPGPTPESLEVAAFRPADIPWRELAFRSTYHALHAWVESRFDRR
jgi:ADP-ribose pyrophosphatase YjhB (NUDIX family)